MFKKLFGQLQRIGKSINVTCGNLACSWIITTIGTAFQGEALQQYLPFIKNGVIQNIANMMTGAGGIIFDNLPIILHSV